MTNLTNDDRLTSQPAPGDLEAMAQAIAERGWDGSPGYRWTSISEAEREEYRKDVRAALSAQQGQGEPVAHDWTGGRTWPEMLEKIAAYFAEFEQERAGAGIYSQEEIAELAGEFATGLADHLTPTAPQPDRDGVLREARFLCERLREFERDLTDPSETNDYFGHCQPSLARLESLLATTTDQSAQSDAVGDDVRRLVIAARNLAFSDHRPVGAPESQAEVELIELFAELDRASEVFADRIEWHEAADTGGEA